MKISKKNTFLLCTAVLTALSAVSCQSGTKATDYSNPSNWAIKREIGSNAQYDLFFLIGTSISTSTKDNGVGDICDEMKTSGIMNYTTIGSQLSFVKSTKNNAYTANVYVPLYRQMALDYELANLQTHEDLPNHIKTKEVAVDLKASLDYYFTNCNKNAERPYVLAGHSQGSASLQVVFEDYFIKGGHKSYLKNCVAAYSIGYGVSKKWFDGLDKKLDNGKTFGFATGALDTNVMISWNTEGPNPSGKSILLPDAENDTYIINPLNWKTDETPATRDENLGVLVKNPEKDPSDPFSPTYVISHEEDELFDGRLNTKRGSLVVDHKGNSGTYVNIPPYGPIWGGQSLHCSDGSAFYVNMARNLGDRLDTWFKK